MNKNVFFLIGIAFVMTLSIGAILVFQTAIDHKSDAVTKEVAPTRSKAEIEAACFAHTSDSQKIIGQLVDVRMDEFKEFVNSKKSGAKDFSTEIISLYGKWRVIKSYLPFTDPDGHKKYVVENFNKYIFTQEELASEIKRTVENSLKDLEGVENELAVKLRSEVLGRNLKPAEIPAAEKDFQGAIDKLINASIRDTQKAAGSLVASEVASAIGTQILVRLGVTAGIFSTSAAAAPWTLGASVVIGVVVDMIWGWIDDPAGDIEKCMIESLDKLSGDVAQAIQNEMIKVINERRQLWVKTIQEMVQ